MLVSHAENPKNLHLLGKREYLGVAEQSSGHAHQLSLPYGEVLSVLQNRRQQLPIQLGDLRKRYELCYEFPAMEKQPAGSVDCSSKI